MIRRWAFTVGFLLLVQLAGSAYAQEQEAGGGGLLSSGGDSWFALEPRVWLTFVQAIDESDLKKETIFVPMGGASLIFTPPVVPGLSVLFTALYGEGEGDATLLGIGPGIGLEVDAEIERLDLEALIRYQLPETNLSFFVGPRFVTFDETYSLFGIDRTLDTQLIVVEAGLGGYGELTDSGRHRIFGNLTGGLAFRESDFDDELFAIKSSEDEIEWTLDINLGYQWIPTDWMGLNFRYRTFLYFNTANNDFGSDDVLTVHGPELGVTIRF